MKRIVLLSALTIGAVVIAVFQQGKLSALSSETSKLESRRAQTAPSPKETRDAAPEPPVSEREIQMVSNDIADLLAFQDRSKNQQDGVKRIYLAASRFSATDIGMLIRSLQADPRLPTIAPEMIVDACHEILREAAPFAWLAYLDAHRELPDWQSKHESCYNNCLIADEARALAIYQDQSAAGNPDFATTNTRQSVLLALAANDPDKMLALAVSPECTADPDALALLGGFVDDRLASPAEHLRFLTTLRHASEKNPSPVLATIRKDYVREMASQFWGWSFDDVTHVIDAEFTADERLGVIANLCSRSDLTEPNEWIDCFLRITPEQWDDWASRNDGHKKHPLIRQIESRAMDDPETTARWLEKIPPGELRDRAVLAHAWRLADRDPLAAAGFLDRIPDGKGKRHLIHKIQQTGTGIPTTE